MSTLSFFFFNDTATTEIYTLSLHDALPISLAVHGQEPPGVIEVGLLADAREHVGERPPLRPRVERLARGDERRSEEHTSELQSRLHLVCRLLLEKKKRQRQTRTPSN